MNSVSDSLKWVVAAAVAVGLGLASAHAEDKNAAVSRGDRNAMEKMAQSDLAEVEAGKVAQQKASNDEVKKFAEHMVQEHAKSLEEGKQLASAKGLQPPSAPDRKHKSALEKLQKSDGGSFDRLYMRQMVQDHEDALKLVKKTAKDAQDPQLKAQAEKLAPHIEEHLAQARKISDSLGARSDRQANARKK
jgi:putative membrane protein